MDSSATGLAHVVFFSLTEPSPGARRRLIAACRKYLADHPGTVHFSVGARGEKYDRDVNDTEFDVALVLVFATEADHDRYQISERHQEFVREQSANWRRVRVFDSLV